MRADKLKVGELYHFKSAYACGLEVYKCVNAYFNEAQNQWLAAFEIMTETHSFGGIGRREELNEIEINRYIFEIPARR